MFPGNTEVNWHSQMAEERLCKACCGPVAVKLPLGNVSAICHPAKCTGVTLGAAGGLCQQGCPFSPWPCSDASSQHTQERAAPPSPHWTVIKKKKKGLQRVKMLISFISFLQLWIFQESARMW